MKKTAETYQSLNFKFYDALNDVFNIKKHKTWKSLSEEITIEKIKLVYEIFRGIFSYNLDRYSLLPKNDPKEKLTAIFHGTLDGETIINNIARYSLYCDEIIVFHPLQNPSIIHPNFNPIIHPSKWKYEFVKALYFYIVLEKWVRSGLVHLIENPFMFDMNVFTTFVEESKKRINGIEKNLFDDEIKAEFNEMRFEKHKQTLHHLPLENIESMVAQVFPNYSPAQKKKVLNSI